jgi:predicted amidohydrolase
LASALGAGSGLLILSATRFALLGWIMLTPLCAAVYWLPPPFAALAGLIAGACSVVPNNWGRLFRHIEIIMVISTGILWGVSCALAAWLWPNDSPGWGALLFPIFIVIATAIPELNGAPRFGANPFLRSQERWLPVVHVVRLGHDLFIAALLALSATIPAMLLVQAPSRDSTVLSVTFAAVVIVGALMFGWTSYRTAVRRASMGPLVRVAAVAIAGHRIRLSDSAMNADVEGTIRAYEPLMQEAIGKGARVVVLPEVAVAVTSQTRPEWLNAISRWAREGKAIVVAGLIDRDVRKNQLVMADESGQIAVTYDKQHPVPGAEAKRRVRMPPALLKRDGICVSGVICVDLDYADLVRPVSKRGGILVAPSNDWRQLEEIHHDAAVWSVAMTRVPLVRATANGTSAIFDAAGRVIQRASAFDGPVVVVAAVAVINRG